MCSATMMVVRLVTVEGTRGMLEASTTRRFCSPRTAPTESTTAAWSVAPPMGTVDVFGYPQKEQVEVLPRQFIGRTEIPRGHSRLVDRFDDQDGQLGGVGQGSLVGVAGGPVRGLRTARRRIRRGVRGQPRGCCRVDYRASWVLDPMRSAARSAIPSTAALGGADTREGITDASTTRRPSIP